MKQPYMHFTVHLVRCIQNKRQNLGNSGKYFEFSKHDNTILVKDRVFLLMCWFLLQYN